MSRFPKPNPQAHPDHLEFEAQLDLLVDDELPDDTRASLLQSLEQAPTHYRTLAHRFLERQTERKAVKQFIVGNACSSDLPAHYPFHAHRNYWPLVRNVAAVFVIAALSAYGGIHYTSSIPAHDTTHLASALGNSTSIPVDLPASIVGPSAGKVAVQIPLLNQAQTPVGYPFAFTDTTDTRKNHIVLMPIGNNRAVVFPVTTDANEIH